MNTQDILVLLGIVAVGGFLVWKDFRTDLKVVTDYLSKEENGALPKGKRLVIYTLLGIILAVLIGGQFLGDKWWVGVVVYFSAILLIENLLPKKD